MKNLRIDDVEDDSVLRRGSPAAHHIYGTPQTINCANYVYFLALAEISKLNKPAMITIYTEELINLHRGQGKRENNEKEKIGLTVTQTGMELYWRDTLTCPTEEDFLEMVNDSKVSFFNGRSWHLLINIFIFIETGGLLRLAVKLMQEASQSEM